MNEFSLRTREEVQRFEELFMDYIKAKTTVSFDLVRLVGVFDALQRNPQGGRIFAAFFDIVLNTGLLLTEIWAIGSLWNRKFSKGQLEGGSILDTAEKFSGKIQIHHHMSSFIFRYRALWDKIMGLIVLRHAPQEYDVFSGAKSKRSAFRKLATKHPHIGPELADAICQVITDFDAKFRTPEAHGSGALRKWSLTMVGMDKNPQIELIGHYNKLLGVMGAIQKDMSEAQLNGG